jgi:hypothetical protein
MLLFRKHGKISALVFKKPGYTAVAVAGSGVAAVVGNAAAAASVAAFCSFLAASSCASSKSFSEFPVGLYERKSAMGE